MTTIYTDNTQFQKQPGVKPLYITGHWEVFDDTTGQGNYDLSHVSNVAIDRAATAYVGLHPTMLIDIEVFDLFLDYNNAVYNLQNALRRWKSADPQRTIGLYASVPERNYWDAVMLHVVRSETWSASEMAQRRKGYAAWQTRNDRLARDLVPFVDFVCPSIYAFTPTEDHHWTIYAEANLLEALRISQGKPVWPIHWSSYHDGSGNATLPVWIRMVEFLATFPGVDSMIAYAPDGVVLTDGWERPVLAAMS